MNILKFDVVSWSAIVRHLDIPACIAVANTHPRLHHFIYKLARVIMCHFLPNVYAKTNPFPRLLRTNTFTQISANFDFGNLNDIGAPIVKHVLNTDRSTHVAVSTHIGYNVYNLVWTIPGVPPPRGTLLHLLVYPNKNLTEVILPIRPVVQTFLTIDHAVKRCIDECYEMYVERLWELLMPYEPEGIFDYAQIEHRLYETDFCQALHHAGSPIIPPTRENVAKYLMEYRSLHADIPLMPVRAWIVTITI